ncbi:MAG: zinc ribbon domain-containing protein [Bacteroidaceae bacterium]
MAIIKCPECEHPVSENAQICPSCGVKIADNIVVCPDCGKVNIKGTAICTNCGCPLVSDTIKTTPPIPNVSEHTRASSIEPPLSPKSNRGLIITLVVVAVVLILAVGAYMVVSSQQTTEQEEALYQDLQENATIADYENFLEVYPNSAHFTEVQERLTTLKQVTADWQAINLSCSKDDFLNFLHKYPSSPYELNCKNKLDSLDWADAVRSNTTEAYDHYLSQHPNGLYSDDAIGKKSNTARLTVTPEEQKLVSTVFSDFFTSLSGQDETTICTTISPIMKDFFGKKNATKTDVLTFMHKLHKDEGASVEFNSNNDYKITKQTADNDDCNYLVSFSVDQKTQHEDATPTTIVSYAVAAKLTSAGKITELNMRKVS